MTPARRFWPAGASTCALLACVSLVALVSRTAHGQARPAGRRVFDMPGFTAVGEAPRFIDLPAFTAAGAPAHVLELPGFIAAGPVPRVLDLPGFIAAGSVPRAFDLPRFSASGVAAALPTPDAVTGSEPGRRCRESCFEANGTNDGEPVALRGPAIINVDDGSRFELFLGTREPGSSYVSIARDPGGPPQLGTYAIADQCAEPPKSTAAASFVGEFATRAYEEQTLSYLSTGGSLVIERAGEGRFAGRFTLTACRYDLQGKRHDVRVSGTFDAVK